MALTDTIQAKEFEAGAPDIILKGDLRPNQMMAGSSRYQMILDELINEMEDRLGRPITNEEYDQLGREAYDRLFESSVSKEKNQMMASGPDLTDSRNELALELFGKELRLLTEEEMDILNDEAQRLMQKFMADGGRVKYGLGSFVKSIGKGVKSAVKGVARGVKSVAKSDLGKAALAAAALYYGGPKVKGFFEGMSLPSLPTFGLSKKGQGTLASFVIGSLGSAALAAAEAGGLDSSDPNAQIDLDSLTGYLTRGYKNLNPNATDEEVFQFVQENTAEYRDTPNNVLRPVMYMGGRIGYSSGTPSFEEYMRERQGMEQKMNLEQLYKEYLEDIRRKKVSEQKTMAAYGGRIGYAMGTDEKVEMAAGIEGLPVRQNKAGVKELDLRETGGFIQPVGIKEKADDIPAMLSNNEFVYTADAVRAAGGGNINKGAQVMYDTMKKLESKVV